MVTPFAEATAVRKLDSHTYAADFSGDWIIGSVPHGGYVTTCFLEAVKAHFETTLAKQNQPHTIAVHLDFLRRTEVGPATFTIRDIKLGRTASVVHVTLSQGSREEVVGYITNSNFAKEEGHSYSSGWSLLPPPQPVADFDALRRGDDPHWGPRERWPAPDFRKATTHLRSYFPRNGQPEPSCLDMWYEWRDKGTRFTNQSLGFICDMFPQLLERHLLGGIDPYSLEFAKRPSKERHEIMQRIPRMWYPTLLLNIEMKKALPDEGVDIVFLRLRSKIIRNGRYDIEVVVTDRTGDILAVSNHVAMAVSAERNMASRRKATQDESSKL